MRFRQLLIISFVSPFFAACGSSIDAAPAASEGAAALGAAGGEVTGPSGVKRIAPEGASSTDTAPHTRTQH